MTEQMNQQEKFPEIKLSMTPQEFLLSEKVVNEETKYLARKGMNECYYDIRKLLDYYFDMDEYIKDYTALYIIATYFHNNFISFPITLVNAMRSSGKTKYLEFIATLAKGGEGFVLNNVTEAVLFRHPKHHILCIDEIESITSKEKSTLRELINTTYKRGVLVKRVKKMKINGQEALVTESFEPFFPLVLANIKGFEEVISDRGFTIILEKSGNPAIIKKIGNFKEMSEFKRINELLKRFSVVSECSFAKKNIYEEWNNYIDTTYNTHISYNTHNTLTAQDILKEEFFRKLDQSEIDGRNLEISLPLLLTAEYLGEEILEKTISILKVLVNEKKETQYTESSDVSLYNYVAEHCEENKFYSVIELAQHFKFYVGDTARDDETWVNERWLGRALKRLCLIIEKRRLSKGIEVKLNVKKAKEKLKIFK